MYLRFVKLFFCLWQCTGQWRQGPSKLYSYLPIYASERNRIVVQYYQQLRGAISMYILPFLRQTSVCLGSMSVWLVKTWV